MISAFWNWYGYMIIWYWCATQRNFTSASFKSHSLTFNGQSRLGYCSATYDSVRLSCPSIKFFSGPVLRNYTCQLFHILWAYHPYMEPVNCKVILTFWPSALKYELHLENVVQLLIGNYNGNCFICLGYINLPWEVCTVESFWHFEFWPWHYELYLENRVRPIAWLRNYTMLTASYFQGTST